MLNSQHFLEECIYQSKNQIISLYFFTWSVCGSTDQVQKLAAKEFLGENIPSRILMIFPNTQQGTYCIAAQEVAILYCKFMKSCWN
jgi:hypothetical protein